MKNITKTTFACLFIYAGTASGQASFEDTLRSYTIPADNNAKHILGRETGKYFAQFGFHCFASKKISNILKHAPLPESLTNQLTRPEVGAFISTGLANYWLQASGLTPKQKLSQALTDATLTVGSGSYVKRLLNHVPFVGWLTDKDKIGMIHARALYGLLSYDWSGSQGNPTKPNTPAQPPA